jgi:hypothetical protein
MLNGGTHSFVTLKKLESPFASYNINTTTEKPQPILHDPLNLGGTARTLDRTDGAVLLQPGCVL